MTSKNIDERLKNLEKRAGAVKDKLGRYKASVDRATQEAEEQVARKAKDWGSAPAPQGTEAPRTPKAAAPEDVIRKVEGRIEKAKERVNEEVSSRREAVVKKRPGLTTADALLLISPLAVGSVGKQSERKSVATPLSEEGSRYTELLREVGHGDDPSLKSKALLKAARTTLLKRYSLGGDVSVDTDTTNQG